MFAERIAKEHINKMNPDMWDGNGDMPDSFDTRVCTYDIGSKYHELDISFYYDNDEQMWCHYCELRDKKTGKLVSPISGYGVDSYLNLKDSIMDVCYDALFE